MNMAGGVRTIQGRMKAQPAVRSRTAEPCGEPVVEGTGQNKCRLKDVPATVLLKGPSSNQANTGNTTTKCENDNGNRQPPAPTGSLSSQTTLDQWRLDQKRILAQTSDKFATLPVENVRARKRARNDGKEEGINENVLVVKDKENQNAPVSKRTYKTAITEIQGVEAGAKRSGRDLSCVSCGKQWDGVAFMIRCDACHGWSHGDCVDINHLSSRQLTRFSCPRCPADTGPLTVGSDSTSKQASTVGQWKKTKQLTPGVDLNSTGQTTDGPQAEKSDDCVSEGVQRPARASKASEHPDQAAQRQPPPVLPSLPIASATGVAPGRLILFQWNEQERYEALVLARASDVEKRKGKRHMGKKRQYGEDWWHVQWTSDGTFSKSIILLAESNHERWQLLPICAVSKGGAVDVVDSDVQITPKNASDASAGSLAQPLSLNITIGAPTKAGAGEEGKEAPEKGEVKGTECREKDKEAAQRDRKRAKAAARHMDMLWEAICLTQN